MNTLASRLGEGLPEKRNAARGMPNLQKSIITFGAGLMTAWTELQLKRSARPGQEKAFRQLMRALALTEQGRACGLTANTKYTDFNRNAPLRTYESLLPQIERMKRGEADVLWPGQCNYYAVSSGTTAGRTKYLPITDEMVRHFSKAGLASLHYYTQRTGHAGVFQGRHLFLGGATTLSPIPEAAPFEAWGGDLSGITALNLPPWVEKHLYEPGAEIACMTDWPAKLKAIADRTMQRDITLIAGIPSWLLILAQTMRERAAKNGAAPANLQAIWPNLECVVHGGVPVGPFLTELQQACGPSVNFHEVYPASEGFIAAQDAESALGLRLMTDAGIFYEFLPLADYDEARLDQLGAKAVPLSDAKPGVDYVLLMTTPAGLCRYVIGDVVRFVSTKPPRLVYVGRTKLQLSAFGEHVIEKELTDALTKVCHGYDWRVVNFHVAPLFVNSLTGQQRGRHEWWIELRPGTVVTPTGPVLETALDAELQRLNDDYEAKRKGGGMEPPIVRLVMPGIFEQWMRTKGKWGGQNKMPRCRSDRAIADELAQIARFTAE